MQNQFLSETFSDEESESSEVVKHLDSLRYQSSNFDEDTVNSMIKLPDEKPLPLS